MSAVHLAIRVFQGILSDVEVHAEEEAARDRVRDWKEEGCLDSDVTYRKEQVIQVGTPVRELGLDKPFFNALRRNRIRTVEQLTDMTEGELIECHRIGQKAISQIKEALVIKGLALAED